jgi:hypothetical protein
MSSEISVMNNQGMMFVIRALSLIRHSSFVIRHLSFHVAA